MPFKNQIRPDVPNQMGLSTSQNAQGFGMPGGRAMFNLPRFQMPGTTANFGGGFGLSSQNGGQNGGIQPAGVRFSISRQASSDPVTNIINDIGNPLGGTNVNFSGDQQQQQHPLKQRMMGSGGYGENGFTGQKPTSQLSNLGFESQLPGNQGFESALPGWQGYGGGDAAQLGYPSQSPFGMLRNRMLAQPGSMVFI